MDASLVILGVVGTALLIGFLYLRRWYGRWRIVEIIFFAAFANGAAWALCAGVWLWFHESLRLANISGHIGVVLFWFVLYGVVSLIPVGAEAAVYHRLRRVQ